MTEVAELDKGAASQETELDVQEDEEQEDASDQKNPSLLPELNLVIILLSLSSVAEEEYVESEPEHHKDEEVKDILRLQHRRQDIHEPKTNVRRTQRFHTVVRDCRHGRKM